MKRDSFVTFCWDNKTMYLSLMFFKSTFFPRIQDMTLYSHFRSQHVITNGLLCTWLLNSFQAAGYYVSQNRNIISGCDTSKKWGNIWVQFEWEWWQCLGADKLDFFSLILFDREIGICVSVFNTRYLFSRWIGLMKKITLTRSTKFHTA